MANRTFIITTPDDTFATSLPGDVYCAVEEATSNPALAFDVQCWAEGASNNEAWLDDHFNVKVQC